MKRAVRWRLVVRLTSVLLVGGALTAPPQAMAEEASARIDHVILGISDLDRGVRLFEDLTGVKAVFGGRHPGVGTHNALVSLGERTYLEIIAPRSGVEVSARWSRLAGLDEPTPSGWAVGTDDLDRSIEMLREAGFKMTAPAPGSRARPDGSTLEWRSAAVVEPRMESAPFFIEWGKNSEHPATTSPQGCRLETIEIHDPEPAALTRLIKELSLTARVVKDPKPGMVITLACPGGRVVFDGR